MMTERTGLTGRRQFMATMGRRSVLSGSLGVAAAAALPRSHIAKAAATTATVWVGQGFNPQEDAAFKKLADDYMKESGNKLDYTIMPFTALDQKTISALTSGQVPDLIFMDAPMTIISQNAFNDKFIDVTDVVAPYEHLLSDTARLGATFYNKATRKRSYYLCPIKQSATPFHIWGDLVEKAGFKISDIPDTWEERWKFFIPMQQILRRKGMRHLYALGMEITTVGPNDGNNLYQHSLIVNGGWNIVTQDGKLHTDDPQVREAAIRSTAFMADLYKQGVVVPEALSWTDADDNNGFHAKLFLVDFDGTLSTELAMISNKEDYVNAVTLGMPKSKDGTLIPCQTSVGGGFIPKGAKGADVAKDLMKYWMQPTVMNENLKAGLGRWVPAIPSVVKSDPWWMHSSDPHLKPYVEEAILSPTLPPYEGFNPAWGQVAAEQLQQGTVGDVIKNGMTPTQAVEKAFKRMEQIFAQMSFD
jgi:multiple sugar transport system substrate-binding protein